MSNDKRVPSGVPSGGQFATSARSESDVSLGAPSRVPRAVRCPSCGHVEADGSCINAQCRDFDMANPDARFMDVSIRAHSLLPGDRVPGGGRVTSVEMDPPGRSGRKARIDTTNGPLPPVGINDLIVTTRDGLTIGVPPSTDDSAQ